MFTALSTAGVASAAGLQYKQLRQAISLPYPGVLRGTYDHTNGAVSSFSQTTGRRP